MGRHAEAVAEGVAIANAAARLAIRNHILVETIGNDEPYDPEREREFARETLRALADEQQDAAERTHRLRKRAWGKFSESYGTHDYRDRDTRNLRKRERQYAAVAKELRRMAENPDVITALIEKARDAAWGDVEANLQRRLRVEGARPELDPDYGTMREARMQALKLVDLAKLAAHQRRKRENAAELAAELADEAVEGA